MTCTLSFTYVIYQFELLPNSVLCCKIELCFILEIDGSGIVSGCACDNESCLEVLVLGVEEKKEGVMDEEKRISPCWGQRMRRCL